MEIFINDQKVGTYYDATFREGTIELAQSVFSDGQTVSTILEIDNFILKIP
jgi:hypothetical protein